MTITAKIIADSTNAMGTRVTTFELVYPRIIHSELMTHRLFSRNSASSRAVPSKTMLDMIEKDPAMPSHWGKNQAGMKADTELAETEKEAVKGLWLEACKQAVSIARVMTDIGVHKQVVNRITEPFSHMKVVLTGTEFNNWWWLRDHEDADPTIAELAKKMKEVYTASTPNYLLEGQWHMPYVKDKLTDALQQFFDENDNEIALEEALMISASSAAQVSYRKTDGSLEKAKDIYRRLIDSKPCHASPLEHACMVFKEIDPWEDVWPKGITHVDKDGDLWSGNIKNYVQYRQLVKDNAVYG